MKQFLFFLLAALLVGFLIFAVFYWVAHWTFRDAVNIGACGALGGMVAEYVKLYYEKRKRENRI
jgi:hypothetical protein